MKKSLPAWQQVVLIVLNGIFSVRNGREAWDKLSDGEKAAMADFLTEHCGADASSAMEETCAIARPSRLSEGMAHFWALPVLLPSILPLSGFPHGSHPLRGWSLCSGCVSC